jgi:hypothetical protein
MNGSEDLSIGQAFPLTEAVKYLPKRNGKKVHYSTLYRWATKGARGRILETMRVGGIRYTTLAALKSFSGNTVGDPVERKRQQSLHELMNRAGL